MASQGFIKGKDTGFAPNDACSKEEALVIAQKMADVLKPKTEETTVETEKEKEDYVIGFIGGSLTEGGGK